MGFRLIQFPLIIALLAAAFWGCDMQNESTLSKRSAFASLGSQQVKNTKDDVVNGGSFEARIKKGTFRGVTIASYGEPEPPTNTSKLKDGVDEGITFLGSGSLDLYDDNNKTVKPENDFEVCMAFDSALDTNQFVVFQIAYDISVSPPIESISRFSVENSTLTIEQQFSIFSLACFTTNASRMDFFLANVVDNSIFKAIAEDKDPPVISDISTGNAASFTNTTNLTVAYTTSETLKEVCLREDTVQENCRWITTVKSPMTMVVSSGDGEKTIYFYGKDLAGNISLPASTKVTLDTTPPILLDEFSLPSKIVDGTFTFEWPQSSDEDIESYNVEFCSEDKYCFCDDEQCVSDCEKNLSSETNSLEVTGLTIGRQYIACLQTEDKAGNTSRTNVSSSTATVLVYSRPTMSEITDLAGASEDTAFEIEYADLAAASNAQDSDGQTTQYLFTSLASGTLTKNGVAAVANKTVLEPGDTWVWTPSLNTSGTIDAFYVKAYDGRGTNDVPVLVSIVVAEINDAPTLSSISTLTGGVEDTNFAVTFAAVSAAANEGDVDGDSVRFKLVQVLNGQLRQGAVSLAAGALLSSGGTWVWTPPANSNGSIEAFTVIAKDDHTPSLESSTPVTVSINFTPVNDAPTLTTISTLGSGTENNGYVVSYSALSAASNVVDVENEALTFRVQAVTNGTLKKSSIAVTAGTTELASGESLVWSPPSDTTGTAMNAFTVLAKDATGAVSTSAVQVKIEVNSQNSENTITANNDGLTLIGGYGSDTLTGGDGSDILIADDNRFTTSTVTGLALWLDAQAPGYMTRTSSTQVKTWGDISSLGNDATDTSAGSTTDRPTLPTGGAVRSGINGRNIVNFDPTTSQTLALATLTLPYEMSVFAFIKNATQNTGDGGTNPYGANPLIAASGCNPFATVTCVGYSFNLSTASSGQLEAYLSNGTSIDSVKAAYVPTEGYSIVDFTKTGTAGYLYSDTNWNTGSSHANSTMTRSSGATFVTGYSLGSYPGFTETLYKGDIGDILVYNVGLTEPDRKKVMLYLSYKYGKVLAGLTFGIDTLTGGDGADTFKWTNASHSGITSGTRDIITDFTQSEGDKIDLSGFPNRFDILGLNGVFSASTSYADHSYTSQIAWAQEGNNTIVKLYWGVSSQAGGDFQIELESFTASNLSVNDFVFATPYKDKVLSLNPTAYLRFNDSTAAAQAAGSVGSVNGTWVGAENTAYNLQQTGFTYPNVDKAIKFNGDNAGVSMGDIMNSLTSGMSASFWIKLTDTTLGGGGDATAVEGILYKGTSPLSSDVPWEIYCDKRTGQNKLIFAIHDATTDQTVEDGTSTCTGLGTSLWHHIVAVWTPSTQIALYRNGVLVGESTSSILASLKTATSKTVKIGDGVSDSSVNKGLKAYLDEVALFSTPLTAAQVLALYRSEVGYK